VIFELGKETFISRHILHQHWYNCPFTLPVRRNTQQKKILLTVVSATSVPPFQPLCHHWKVFHVSRLSCEELYAIHTSHRKRETFLYEYPLHWVILPHTQNTHSRTLLSDSTLLKHGPHFHYRNQPLNMSMRVCYLDCHEAGLCCCLVIHIENILHSLQLFYLHLWPIYWLSLVYNIVHKIINGVLLGH
jgi:hypothetical protein